MLLSSVATLPPIAPIANPWARILIWLAETAASSLIYQHFEAGAEIQPAGTVEGDPEQGTWRHFQFKAEDTLSAATADDQFFTIDVANITNGNVDSSWTDADYTAVFGALDGMCLGLASSIDPRLKLSEIRAYARGFNPYSNQKPFTKSGAPEKIHAMAYQGTGGGASPPQCTTTVTELTPSRANWGRFYLPTLSSGSWTGSGRMTTPAMTAVLTAVHTAYSDLMSAGFFPVVPTTSVGGSKDTGPKPVRTLQTVTGVRIDDVADVVRRRRHREPQAVQTLPV